eukprot:TRINITY_DN5447_c0_g2_i1.p1 TRINITY_DN5447_c0_g2~~TRINITY_DN5447_c0_g2_i1.p1  ORF type:complete len:397 (+),score=108.02 TRINITY_DN5447_c0_g2_i1:139-1329(+)
MAMIDSESSMTFVEAISMVGTELAMFSAAVLFYVAYKGMPSKRPHKSSKKEGYLAASCHNNSNVSTEDIYRQWQQSQKATTPDTSPELYAVITAMSQLNKKHVEVESELRLALEKQGETMLTELQALPPALLRDNAIGLLPLVLELLQSSGRPADTSTYASLMAAQLRQKNFKALAATAKRLPESSMTPKIRAILATAAAHNQKLDEVLQHIRQLPALESGHRSAISFSAATQIMKLATEQQRTSEVLTELHRVGPDLQQSTDSIKAYARSKDLAKATAVYTRVRDSGLGMQADFLKCYFDACVHCDNKAASLRVFEEMKAQNFVDLSICSTALKLYLAAGRMLEARKLVEHMEKSSGMISKSVAAQLLKACRLPKDYEVVDVKLLERILDTVVQS